MKKVIAIVVIVALASCNGTTSTPILTDSTKVDSTVKVVDSVKLNFTK